MWWTRPTFGLHLHRQRDCFPNTHCADNRSPWRLAIFAMFSVSIFCFPRPHVATRWPLTPIHREPGAIRVFPYQVIFPYNNTAQNCLTQCSTFGYPAAGMENGDECCVFFYCSGAFTRLLTENPLTRVRRSGGYHKRRSNNRRGDRLHHSVLRRPLTSLWRSPEATALPLEWYPEQLADPCQHRSI